MQELRIEPQFKSLIPPLSEEEFELLKNSIIKEGIRDAIVVWDETIIDGHNRYKICTEYNMPFKTVSIDFEDDPAAKEWIMKNQLGRRNLPDVERGRIALKLKDSIAARAKERQGTRTDLLAILPESDQSNICPILDKSIDTKKELAKLAGLSHGTLAKIEKVDTTAPEPIKQAMGTIISIDKAYNLNEEIQKSPPAEQETVAEKILQEELSRQFKRIDQETKIYNKLSDIMSYAVHNREYITDDNVEIYLRLNKGSESASDIQNIIDLSISEMMRLKQMFENKNCIRRIK